MLGLTPYYFDYTPTIRFAKIRDFYQRNNSTANFVCESRKKTASLKIFSIKEIKTLCSTSQLPKRLSDKKRSQPFGMSLLWAGSVSSFWHTDFFYLYWQPR